MVTLMPRRAILWLSSVLRARQDGDFQSDFRRRDKEPTEGLLNAVYACTVCGACYEKCKQITSVELGVPELFEEMRSGLASKGWIIDAHKSIVEKIKETKNAYGEKYEYKAETTDWNADVIYYIGCTARYRMPEIADAMLRILDKLGLKYQVMGEEWCCGSGGGVKSDNHRKDRLYQNLVPKRVRHDLCEYFTPDWLAELVLKEVEYDGNLEKRVLDPACGGSFYFLQIVQKQFYRLFSHMRHYN